MAAWESGLLHVHKTKPGSSLLDMHNNKSPSTSPLITSQLTQSRDKTRALTCTFHSLSNETPHKVGTVFTPVWPSECMHLKKKRGAKSGKGKHGWEDCFMSHILYTYMREREMGSHCCPGWSAVVYHSSLRPPSSDPPTSASWVAGTTNRCYHAWIIFL